MRQRGMYKYASGQIRFEDFCQPVGMCMDPENRWVRRAESIPWDEIEHRVCGAIQKQERECGKTIASGPWSLHHSVGIRLFGRRNCPADSGRSVPAIFLRLSEIRIQTAFRSVADGIFPQASDA